MLMLLDWGPSFKWQGLDLNPQKSALEGRPQRQQRSSLNQGRQLRESFASDLNQAEGMYKPRLVGLSLHPENEDKL